MNITTPHPADKVSTVPLDEHPGWTATAYKTRHRESGRRIVVRDEKGVVRHDTDDQYDMANAISDALAFLRNQK